jgi:hypothetical protein
VLRVSSSIFNSDQGAVGKKALKPVQNCDFALAVGAAFGVGSQGGIGRGLLTPEFRKFRTLVEARGMDLERS